VIRVRFCSTSFSISIVFVVIQHSQEPKTQEMSSAAQVAQVALVAPVVDDLAGTPLAGLSRQLKPGEVGELGLESREIDTEIDIGRLVHRALGAVEAKESKARNLKEAGV
jgi:hypothetical protein